MKRLWEIATTLANAAFLIAGIALLVFAALAAYKEQPALVAVCTAGSILLIFASTIDRFESVKGLGVEAKTRQLDRKLLEADEAISKLRQLAEILGKESVAANSRLGRLNAAPSTEESYLHAQEVRNVMIQLGSSQEKIRTMMEPFIRVALFDMAMAILHPVHKNLQQALQVENSRNRLVPEDPKSTARRASETKAAYAFQNDYHHDLHKRSPEELAVALATRLAQVPLVDENVRRGALQEILRFSGDMSLLRSEGKLDRPDAWFERISIYRNRDLFNE